MKKLNNKGFSLVELLVTITILGILMAVAVASVFVYLDNSRKQAMDTIASTSYDGMVNYMMENNILLNPKGEANSTAMVQIKDLYEENYIEKPTDPYNDGGMCEGTVTVRNETTSSTTGLEDYRYEVHVECSGDHVLDVSYPKN